MSRSRQRHRRGGHSNGRIHGVPDLSGLKPLKRKDQPKVEAGQPATTPVVVTARPPDPNLQFAQSWQGDYGHFAPTVTEEAYHQFVEMLLQEHQIEIAGIFHLNEADDTIDWFWRDQASKGSGGGVHSDDGQGIVAAMLAGVGIPNGQWHTHPGFGTFWSGTDLTDQGATVRDAMQIATTGTTYFIVANALNWRIRKVSWVDGKINQTQDGHVLRWDGYPLNYADKGRSTSSPVTATYPYGYGLNGGSRRVADRVGRPADEIVHGYGYGDDDNYKLYWQERGNRPNRDHLEDRHDHEHPLLLPAAVGQAVRQDAVVWAVPGINYGPLFDRFNVEEGEWDFLQTSVNRVYPGLFPEIMAHPELWPEL